MGDNALSTATPGQVIPSDHHNGLVQALLQNIVPRNASRVAEDLAGQLGTSAYRWLRAYIETYHIGTPSNNLLIYEGATGEIWIQRNDASNETLRIKDGTIEAYIAGIKKFDVTSTGINWATQASKSIPFEKLNYQVIDIPQTNANNAIVFTTTALCLMFFIPTGSRMEDDSPVGLFVDNYFVDTDGGQADLYLYYSRAGGNAPLNLNQPVFDGDGSSIPVHGSNTMIMCQPGKNIRAFIANSSDRIGGTLYVFPLG